METNAFKGFSDYVILSHLIPKFSVYKTDYINKGFFVLSKIEMGYSGFE